jgi:hypothetical protein
MMAAPIHIEDVLLTAHCLRALIAERSRIVSRSQEDKFMRAA